MERMNPLNDVAFKGLFVDEELLRDFLDSVLDFQIDEVQVTNAELVPESDGKKIGILDIKAQTSDGTNVNIEVQLRNQYNMRKRSQFYLSKMIAQDLNESEDYGLLNRAITINILGFKENDEENFHSVFQLKEKSTHKPYIEGDSEIHLIEIPKFLQQLDKTDLSNPFHRWLIFLSTKDENLLKEVIEMDSLISKAESKLESFSQDDKMRELYEKREKERRDEISLIKGAVEEGKEIGKKIGKEIGKELGKELGEQLEKERNAKKMKELGVDAEIIKEVTGLDPDKL